MSFWLRGLDSWFKPSVCLRSRNDRGRGYDIGQAGRQLPGYVDDQPGTGFIYIEHDKATIQFSSIRRHRRVEVEVQF